MEIKQRISQQFSRAAAGYDEVADVQQRVAEYALSRVCGQPHLMLDIGCGTGRHSRTLSQRADHVMAIDLADGMLRHAKSQYKTTDISWLQADAEALPLLDNSVSCVFSSMALQWCPSVEQALAEIYRVLKPGGQGVLAVVCDESLAELKQAWPDDTKNHVNPYPSTTALISACQAVGFSVVAEKRKFTEWFPSVRQLLNSIRRAGANVVTTDQSSHFNRNLWRQLQDNFKSHYCPLQGFPLSYQITILEIKK